MLLYIGDSGNNWIRRVGPEGIITTLPREGQVVESTANRAAWARWQEGLSTRFTLLDDLPP